MPRQADVLTEREHPRRATVPALNFWTARRSIACAVYLLLHLATHLSAKWFEVAPGVSVWYAPNGLALALLILIGPRSAPIVFATNALGAVLSPGIHAWWDPWLYPALITLYLTGVAMLVRRLHGNALLPGTTRETVFFAMVTVGAPALMAVSGTGIAVLLGLTAPDAFAAASVRWWVGDASGLLTVVPVAMVFGAPWLDAGNASFPGILRQPRHTASFAAKAAVLLAVLCAAFFFDPDSAYNAHYLCFLPLVWISLTHGIAGATVATLAITMVSLVGLHLTEASTERTVAFLFFELTVAVVGLGLGVAVTRRNAVTRKLVESEARLDRVLTGAQLGMWDWTITTGAVTYNARCAEMLDLPLSRIGAVEPSWQEFAHPDDRPQIAAALAAHLDGRLPLYEVDFRARTRTGQWRWIHSRGSVVARDANGSPTVLSGTHQDITERRETDAAMRRLFQIIEVTTDFILTTDAEGRITHANAALLRFLGIADVSGLRGRSMREILPPATLTTIDQQALPAALSARTWLGEAALTDAQGDPLPVSLVVLLHRGGVDERESLSFIMRDLSHQKAAEAGRVEHERRLQQVQKTESLGVLAGGVAHDFNNLLTTILGNTNLARLDLGEEAPQQELLQQVETAAIRAGELCQLMLAYAGRAPLALADLDVGNLIKETHELLRVSIPRRIEVSLNLDRPLPAVHAARAQLQQVIMNLVLNAAHAIGDRSGRILIRVGSRRLGTMRDREHTHGQPLTPGTYVVLEVEDDGCGMSAETRARIFDPFFTTKVSGRGLGLAAVHGIVRSHEGSIEVLSTEGRGSLFRVFLPARCLPVEAAAIIEPDDAESPATGVALVVDDEPSVRRIASRLMESLGYETIQAATGEEGVEQFRLHADRLQVVLLDLTMPRISGEEVFAEMRRFRPTVPVIIMSGYSERLTLDRFGATAPAGFLSKPFDRHTLQTAIRAVANQTVSA